MKTLGLVLTLALLASGCATHNMWTGYGAPVTPGDREVLVGRYPTLDLCQQDPQVARCEENRPPRNITSPSIFLPGGTVR